MFLCGCTQQEYALTLKFVRYFTFAFERRGKPARIPVSPIDWQKDSSTVLCRKEVCCFFWEMC